MCLDEDVEVTWRGGRMPFDAEIPLRAGWNTVPYYPTYELEADVPDYYVVTNILDEIIIAKDEDGRFMYSGFGYSGMLPWRQGKGYKIQVEEEVLFRYPEEQEMAARAGTAGSINVADRRWYLPPQSDRNMSVLMVSFMSDVSSDGDNVGAFSTSGRLVGAGVILKGACGFAVWGDIPESEDIEGLIAGEAFELRLWDMSSGETIPLNVALISAGDDLTYRTDKAVVIEVDAVESIDAEFFISGCYPNPFNAVTVLSYGVSTHSRVVINVYDLRGVLVKTLISSDHPAGSYRVAWNGSNLPSGVYIISMRSKEFFAVRKVVLMR